mmetsp:Transcript_22301/g.37306  ORF Transcript_22301/g.37306 Transcript_22301/m.37306 type:complete len:216 (-) Transcript_22301:221-868(-)|eukprot:CAMPEP_0174956358 /NCGR_PEP_ID=MMETSP0004_2-20121128/1484_1 /TAXON_ID=420556 /ORGANISM="Ochromonas sp., Strain CCMP1393" /LENGTH=215 /DNA_ID=CAMNT_0016204371 /DNA_START=99 /DNA_END=746 /DNA_ORIENTATION=+
MKSALAPREINLRSRKNSVSFNVSVDVILIPEVKEIKAANLDLWWTGTDFFAFKQSAQSEIKLFALYENVNCREAKKLLYQPNSSQEGICEQDILEMNVLQSPSTFIRHNDSISILSDASFANKDETPSEGELVAFPNSPTQGKSMSLSFAEIDSRDEHASVSLCVRSSEFNSLSTKERKSKFSSSKPTAGMAMLFGFVSFTVPVVGYYIMHYAS